LVATVAEIAHNLNKLSASKLAFINGIASILPKLEPYVVNYLNKRTIFIDWDASVIDVLRAYGYELIKPTNFYIGNKF
jgi:hypothetical protein